MSLGNDMHSLIESASQIECSSSSSSGKLYLSVGHSSVLYTNW